jgi:hypothetical protein
VNKTSIRNPLFLEYGLWRLKQGLVESIVIESIRKLKRISKYAGLDHPEEVKQWIATGSWRKSYKESLVNVYAAWCDFINIPFEKPK